MRMTRCARYPLALTPRGAPNPIKKRHRERLGRSLRTQFPGECVAFDTVVHSIGNTRRYIFIATDHASRFAFALAVPRATSSNAARFVQLVQALFPAPIRQVLTDNGSEFLGAFDQYAQKQGWRHCHTYPRCPKMNAYNERFNRTIQEEFVDYQEDLLLDDLSGFNDRLLEYLQRYNGERPHYGLNYLTPCQSIATLLPDLPRSWWHHTVTEASR